MAATIGNVRVAIDIVARVEGVGAFTIGTGDVDLPVEVHPTKSATVRLARGIRRRIAAAVADVPKTPGTSRP